MLINKQKLLNLFLVISIIIFFFNLFCLNDKVFSDGELYISETKNLLEGKSLSPIQQMFPLKHYLMQGLFTVVPLPIEQFNKLFPLIVMFICFVFAFLISKTLFEKNYLPALIIGFGNYWVLNFFALNYIESLVTLFLLAYFWFFLSYEKNIGNELINILGMLAAIFCLLFTKIIGLVLAPFLFLFFLLLIFKHKKKFFILSVIPFVFLVFRVLNKNNKSESIFGMLNTMVNKLVNFFVFSLYSYLIQFGRIVLLLFYFPPNEIINENIFGVSLAFIKFVFLLMVLPLFLFGCYCVVKSFFEKELFFKAIGVTCFVTFCLLITYLVGLSVQVHCRYVLIVLPLLGFLLFKYWLEIKEPLIKKVLLWLFGLFGLYGFCYSIISTLYHIII